MVKCKFIVAFVQERDMIVAIDIGKNVKRCSSKFEKKRSIRVVFYFYSQK